MKKTAPLICYMLLQLLSSCNSDSINEEQSIYTIDLSRNNEITGSDFSTSISKTIKLESSSNSIFGSISKIAISNNKIYIFDNFNTQEILVFDIDGKFIHSLYQIGRGPGEVAYPKDFVIDKDGNIHVFDQIKHSVKVYNSNGNIIDINSLGCSMKNFSILLNGNYIGYIGNRSNQYINNTLITNNLVFFNSSNELYNQMYPLEEDITYYHLGGGLSQNYKNETIFSAPGDYNIYKVFKKEPVPFCRIQLGKHTLPLKLIEQHKTNYLEFHNRLARKTNYIYYFNQFVTV